MKKLLMTVVVASLLTGGINAYADGHRKGGDHDSPAHFERMVKKLELNDEQKKQAEAIFKEAKDKKDALDKKYNVKQYRAEKHAIQSGKKLQVSEILNDEQKAKYEKMCNGKKKKGKKGQRDAGPMGKK